MKTAAILSCVGALGMFALGAHAGVFTLADALATTYETNPQLAAARAGLRASDEDVARARAGLRPKITVEGYYGLSETEKTSATTTTHPLSGTVALTQDIFRGGQTFAEIERAKSLDRAERGRLIGTEQSVLLDAVTAYMDVVRDTGRMKISRTNVDVLRQTYENVKKMFAVGMVTKTDLQQAEARFAQAKLGLYSAQAALDSSLAAFERLIGRPAETLETSPSVPKIPASLDAALREADARHPEVLIAKNEERAADQAVNDAIGAMLPHFSVSGQYRYTRDYQSIGSYQFSQPQNQFIVLGQVTMPIYQGGGEQAAVRQAKNLLAKAKYSTTDTRKRVQQGVRSSWSAYQAAIDSIEASQAQAHANEQAVEGVRLEQKGGERSVLDVLNAQQELLSAQTAALNAEHDRIIAAYRVLAATGGLTASTLKLAVKPYDPMRYYNDNASKWIGLGE
ncbi:TolC family outer membrane protein [Rhizomicrobium electricum]|uniref:TolC family outer membrane protein n=1 Tax=Rhizomicrobium electricum TaxID=480070 RepID=A0ABP3P9X9_9PROT|nr:TolC family outer membrane protein [Rhizomicrobium electricum]NIJ47902.1 outer membrane protein [Rhizomicrobium electricum]